MHIEQARGFESGKVGFQGCMDSSAPGGIQNGK